MPEEGCIGLGHFIVYVCGKIQNLRTDIALRGYNQSPFLARPLFTEDWLLGCKVARVNANCKIILSVLVIRLGLRPVTCASFVHRALEKINIRNIFVLVYSWLFLKHSE